MRDNFYKYNPDNSYSIEILSYEENRLKYYKYNSKHECLLTVFDNSDSTLHKYNSLGKLEGLTYIKNSRKVEFDFAELDSNGNVTRVNYNAEGVLTGFSVYKFNNKGLQEEIKQFGMDGKNEKYMGKTELR